MAPNAFLTTNVHPMPSARKTSSGNFRKDHQCVQCGLAFVREDSLRAHMRAMGHAEDPAQADQEQVFSV